MKYQFGFIGVGNMGGALARATCKSAGAEAVAVCDRYAEKAEALAAETGCTAASAEQVIAESKYIVLGAKPQELGVLLDSLKAALQSRRDQPVIISMAAGVPIETIKGGVGDGYPVIRIMPNTPASVGQGMILYTTSSEVTAQEIGGFLQGMAAAGRFDALPEKLMNAGSAISGCGPAFAYMFMAALADGGVKCGLPFDKALLYAAQTLSGAAQLVMDSGTHPEVLKTAVCSPGGSTIEGVHTLESGAFRALCMDTVCAAYRRTEELGK